jgi:hypothetical protein
MTASEGAALAANLLLREFSLDPPGLAKLHRLKEIIDFHPTIVNPTLTKQDQSYYFQVLHDCVHAIAIVLEDIVGEKDVEPFKVETFGEPAHRPPIRLSAPHRQFVRDEFAAVKGAGLAKSMHTPWAAPCFPVAKPRSDKLRLVIDFRGLN